MTAFIALVGLAFSVISNSKSQIIIQPRPLFYVIATWGLQGDACWQIYEPDDPNSSQNNYLCFPSIVPILVFTNNGSKPAGWKCTNIYDPQNPAAIAWTDNYLCVQAENSWWFEFLPAGPVPAGKVCSPMSYSGALSSGYLCSGGQYYSTPTATANNGAVGYDTMGIMTGQLFKWSNSGPIFGYVCVQWLEPLDPDGWDNNFLCFKDTDHGVKFSSNDTIAGMTCTSVNEPMDSNGWSDNYLCVPADATWKFAWSANGGINGLSCTKIDEGSDPNGWDNNFLCVEGPSRNWIQLNGTAVQLSSRGNELWAITDYNQVARLVNGQWKHTWYLGHNIAASPDGYAWMMAKWDKANIYRMNAADGTATGWTEPVSGWGSRISASSALVAIIVGADGCIYKTVNNGAWSKMPGECNVLDASIGDNGETWKIDYNWNLYRLNQSGTWDQQITDFIPTTIDVQSSTRVVAMDNEQRVYFWNGSTWEFQKDNGCVQATINYQFITCVDDKNLIWKKYII